MANNTKLTFPKAVEVAPGMFRAPQPVSKAAQPLTTDGSTSPYKEDVKDGNPPINPALEKQSIAADGSEPIGHLTVTTGENPRVEYTPTPSEMDGLVSHAKLVRLEMIQKWGGKPGVNPYIWAQQNIDPLLERVKRGDTSDELKKKLLRLNSDTKPVVNVPVVEKTK